MYFSILNKQDFINYLQEIGHIESSLINSDIIKGITELSTEIYDDIVINCKNNYIQFNYILYSNSSNLKPLISAYFDSNSWWHSEIDPIDTVNDVVYLLMRKGLYFEKAIETISEDIINEYNSININISDIMYKYFIEEAIK